MDDAAPLERRSHALEQFFLSLRSRSGLSVLDLAGANQANISFIANLGHRIYTEDFVKGLDAAFAGEDFYAAQSDRWRAAQFFEQNLRLPPASVDGALVWDSLQYLAPLMLEMAVDRIHEILKPDAYLLAFFHANEKAETLPVYSYRIADTRTLRLTPRGQRSPSQFFNNRGLERIFQKFQSIKFFLTREQLREVLVRR